MDENSVAESRVYVAEQLRQLQMLMHRVFHGAGGGRSTHNPFRGQGRVLSVLKLKPEISQKELGYLLGMSKQALAELLAKLEKSGYISREPSEQDKRIIMISLTAEGMKTAEDMDEGTTEMFQYEVLECLDDDELENLREYLSRIIKRYEVYFPDEDFEERRKLMSEFRRRSDGGTGEPEL